MQPINALLHILLRDCKATNLYQHLYTFAKSDIPELSLINLDKLLYTAIIFTLLNFSL